MTNKVYIGLGSNIGDRAQNLYLALQKLNQHVSLQVKEVSSIYETEPIGYTEQPKFLNMVSLVLTTCQPSELLAIMNQIEIESGRERKIRWGPRTIDLDILLYNQENIQTEHLFIPHPRMLERAFVMLPLYELNKTIQIPLTNDSIGRIVQQLPDKKGVRIWKQRSGDGEFGLFGS
jgi:2-amino-4-hydroxy-6-hydroxymethyldihydropteridine diphosphokinase